MGMTATLVCPDIQKWYCGYCLKEFGDLQEIDGHMHEVHEGERYQCDLCMHFRAKTLDAVAQHKLTKHAIVTETFQRHACNIGECTFQTVLGPTEINRHHKILHSEEYATKTQCNICDKRCESNYSLRRHIERVHMGDRPYTCDPCNKSYASRAGLRNHTESQHGVDGAEGAFTCTLCGAVYRYEQGLQDHIICKHKNEDERFKCSQCPKFFAQRDLLNDHVNSCHQEESGIPCPKCDKKWLNAGKLRKHFLGSHLKVSIKPNTCVSCGKAYARAKDCWIHIGLRHELWSYEKAMQDWQRLSREKLELMEKRDCRKEENEALKGQIDDQYLMAET